MNAYRVEHPAASVELPLVGRKIAESFGFPEADAEEWFLFARPENVSALHDGQSIIGGLIRVPMGQFFGGRAVPVVGIAGVGVLPEWRRQGAARFLMSETLRALRTSGCALSSLYASTHGLYASVGYGVAGTVHRGRVTAAQARMALDPALEVRRLNDADRPQQAALYTAQARGRAGHLDRGAYIWHRIFRTWRGRPAYSTGVFAGDRLAGYVVWRRASADPPSELEIGDVVAPTAAVARRIWGFLSDHGTIAPAFNLLTSPTDPFWLALSHPGPDLGFKHMWMLRLLNLPAAIAARGFSRLVSLRVGFQVEDEILKENNGIWTLTVNDGVGRLEPGGAVEATVTIEGLAGLYSGFTDCGGLEARGQLTGQPAATERLDAAFAGPAPWMPEYVLNRDHFETTRNDGGCSVRGPPGPPRPKRTWRERSSRLPCGESPQRGEAADPFELQLSKWSRFSAAP